MDSENFIRAKYTYRDTRRCSAAIVAERCCMIVRYDVVCARLLIFSHDHN